MFKIFDIEKDTFITSQENTKNYGRSSQVYITSASYSKGNKLNPNKDERTLIYFDTNEIISGSGNGIYKYRNFITDLRLMGNGFTVSGYPLQKFWDEGIGKEFDTNIGSSWKFMGLQSGYTWDGSENNNVDEFGLEAWDSEGGDYDASTKYSVDINDNEMIFECDLTNYVNSIKSGSIQNNGIIFIADELNYNLAMNSSDNNSYERPYIIYYEDDYTIQSGSATEYDGDINNALISILHYDSSISRGDNFLSILNINEKYRVSGFTYSRELKYLENIKFKVHYETSDKEFIPYSEYTRVPVLDSFGGLTCTFNTENFPYGLYYIQFKYESDGRNIYSDKKYFMIT